ncbi:MAG: FAD-binding oxidoreductase [Devosiaceae bacterium]|nr:FAD-binding oxidoreductase [Devosiaceae bacterium MH13]
MQPADAQTSPNPNATISSLTELLGASGVLADPADKAPYLREWRDLFIGEAVAVARPSNAQEVCSILRYAHETGTPIVPQGGNTGLVGGQTPDASGRAIILSLARMNAIREIDPTGNTITVDAGAVLERVQNAAAEVERLYPLALGAQGSCTIGGNIATNAGGTGVLAYGNTRDLVLGLEVALPDGRLWKGLSSLRKDNTGYDLKNLFIGSEGTLGIVTAATLKLFPRPKGMLTAFLGLESPQQALAVFSRLQGLAGSGLTGFEIMPLEGLAFVLRHQPGARDPLETQYPWYVLAEISSGRSEEDAQALMMDGLEAALDAGEIVDAAIAQSLEQSNEFWAIRHGMSEVQKAEGASIKHDVSVPVAKVPAFLDEAIAAVLDMVPGCRPVPFGHLGDGNIHFNVSQPVEMERQAFLDLWEPMNDRVHAIVTAMDGSISAEHGIGQLKRDLLPGVKDPVALALMQTLKQAIDPKGIMNPGKVLALP